MITFYKEPSSLQSAYNNCIFEFGDGANATVSVGGYSFDVSAINNRFHFNLKEIVKVLINENEFDEQFNVLGQNQLDPSLWIDLTITFTVDQSQTTTKTVTFLKAAYQIGEKTKRDDIRVLLPSNQLTIFDDLPIDFSVWSDADRTVSGLNLKRGVNRIMVTSDGSVSYFTEGYFDGGYFAPDTIDFSKFDGLKIKKRNCQRGRYVKWFSRFGGWCYWRFEQYDKENFRTKKLEDINRDEGDVRDTDKNFSPLGNLTGRSIELQTGLMDEFERWYFVDFISSPKKYLYQNNNWIEVKTSNASGSIENKFIKQNYKVEIYLPNNYDQLL